MLAKYSYPIRCIRDIKNKSVLVSDYPTSCRESSLTQGASYRLILCLSIQNNGF